MKTVVQKWGIRVGGGFLVYDKKADAMLKLANTAFLDTLPDDTVLTLQPVYVVSNMEPLQIEHMKG